jgi:tRNA/rRNA methyltransferase
MTQPKVSAVKPAPGSSDSRHISVILVRPESWENVGLAARGMANTGFDDLRIVGMKEFGPAAHRTAVHASEILDRARFFDTLEEAASDLHLTLASTARVRRDYPLISLQAAVRKIFEYPEKTGIGLVFGNERTGLTAGEIGLSNVRFRIPQAARQPSYNLGVAVTIALFAVAFHREASSVLWKDLPLTKAEQEEAGRRFRDMLDSRGFMHVTNRDFITERVQDIFRRMVLTAKDRDVILAMFRKAVQGLPKNSQARKENS